jgi:hypothetical protein
LDETITEFLDCGKEDLKMPSDEYFESAIESLCDQDIAIVLQNICEHLVSKKIPQDVRTSFWIKFTLKFLEKQLQMGDSDVL